MSTNLPAERKPQLVAGAPVAALVPQTLEEAFRLSGALAASGMAPRGMDKPEQIMVAIMAGAELGLAPFQSLQSFAVVNGRPTLWGDGLVAVVRARGVRIKEWTEGEGDRRVAFCTVTRPDTGEEITRSFSVDDAKKAGLWGKQGPWQQYPQRMLPMRARAWAMRDGCADMLRGIQVREEVEDFGHARDVTPKPSGLRDRLAGPQAEGFSAANAERTEAEEPHDDQVHFAEHAEEVAAEVESELIDADHEDDSTAADDTAVEDFPGDRPADHADISVWADETRDRIDAFQRVQALDAFANDPEVVARFRQVEAEVPSVARALDAQLRGKRKALADRERG